MENGIQHGEGYYKLELGASGNLIHSSFNQPRSTELPVTGCIHIGPGKSCNVPIFRTPLLRTLLMQHWISYHR
jgi:hypothetical protein